MKPSTSNPTASNFSKVIPQTILMILCNILQYDFYTVQNFTFNFYNVIYGKSAMHFAQCEVGLQYVQVDFSRLLLFMFDPLLHFSTLPSPLSLPCICTESEYDSCGMEICINEKHTNIELENVVENCSTNRLFQKRRNINALIFPIKIEHVRRETTLYAVLEPSSQFSGIFM